MAPDCHGGEEGLGPTGAWKRGQTTSGGNLARGTQQSLATSMLRRSRVIRVLGGIVVQFAAVTWIAGDPWQVLKIHLACRCPRQLI